MDRIWSTKMIIDPVISELQYVCMINTSCSLRVNAYKKGLTASMQLILLFMLRELLYLIIH